MKKIGNQNIYQKNVAKKNIDLPLIRKEGKKHHVLIKDLNTFMYDHTLHRGRKHFCRYYLQAFSTEEILKRHIKDCFTINGKQRINISKKGKYIKFLNFEIKIKSLFMIYTDFERIF